MIGPTVGFTPFPWKQLYIDEMDGKKLNNYYHWMATKYFVTLTTNPAVSLPCGLDHKKMPFGLQVVGRFRGDGEVLGAAHAMEQAFKAIPGLAPPAAQSQEAREADAGAEVDRDPSAEAQRQADQGPGTGRALARAFTCAGGRQRLHRRESRAVRKDKKEAAGSALRFFCSVRVRAITRCRARASEGASSPPTIYFRRRDVGTFRTYLVPSPSPQTG